MTGIDTSWAELHRIARTSSIAVYTFCCNHYWLCTITMGRWRQYAGVHGYDHVVLHDDSMSRDDALWSRYDAASILLGLGYTWVVSVDADTTVLRWEYSLESWMALEREDLPNCAMPSNHGESAGGIDTALVVSRDRHLTGFIGAPRGPLNVGVFALRNSSLATHLLAWQRERRAFMNASLTPDQDSFNTWYMRFASNPLKSPFMRMKKSGSITGDRVTLLRWCSGTRYFMCSHPERPSWIDILFKTSRPWEQVLDELVAKLSRKNIWVFHTLGMNQELKSKLEGIRSRTAHHDGSPRGTLPSFEEVIGKLYRRIDQANPIGTALTAPELDQPWQCSIRRRTMNTTLKCMPPCGCWPEEKTCVHH